MTEDRIKYLRKAVVAMPLACNDAGVAHEIAKLMTEALDEVEKLRATLEQARMCAAFNALDEGKFNALYPEDAHIHDSDDTDFDTEGPWAQHCQALLDQIDAALQNDA